MKGQWIHYGLLILLSAGALITFLFTWWRKKLDWSEEPSNIVFMEEPMHDDE